MAKEKKETKDKEKAPARKKKKSVGLKARLWMAFVIVAAVIFLPTSMLLLVGMLPSIVAFVVSVRVSGAKVSTVTAMNLAGCIPFVFKLWSSGNDFSASMDIITNTRYVSIMYMAAAFGYMINWVVTGIVSSFLYQRGIKRMEAIKKRQKELKNQWGDVVDRRSL
ncbi:MAG: hypothetical protein KAJ29_05345 [Alphaproteobacteria bacterium]|nr:hypothetical protein [Alphaproteobacteria bacterium]